MAEKMRALNLYGVGDLRYDEVERPVPQAGEVLLKVRACGICGSDIPRVFTKGTYHFPTIIGHEFAGEIVGVPSGEDSGLIGKRAAVFPLIPCRHCAACAAEHFAQCANYSYYGSRQDGAMAEYLAVRRENLCLLPEHVSFEAAAMCEPTAVARHAFLKSGAGQGDLLVIYGIGTIAMLIAQWARAAGVSDIVLVARSAAKKEWAHQLGFDQVFDIKKPEDAAALKARLLTKGGADACIEGTGASEGLSFCLRTARPFGTIVTLGNPVGRMELSQDDYWQILRRELVVKGTWNSKFFVPENDWQKSLEAMESGAVQPERIITHRFRLKDYHKAFALMRDKRELYGKVMFLMDGSSASGPSQQSSLKIY